MLVFVGCRCYAFTDLKVIVNDKCCVVDDVVAMFAMYLVDELFRHLLKRIKDAHSILSVHGLQELFFMSLKI